MWARWLLVGVLLVGAAACSSDDDSAGAPATSTPRPGPSTSTTAVDPTGSTTAITAPSVTPPPTEDRVIALTIPAVAIEEEVGVGSGTTVRVGAPRIGRDDTGPWLEVPVEARNGGTQATTAPAVELVCLGLLQGGGTVEGTTYPAGAPLAPGATVDGVARLLVPGDGRYGDPPYCVKPAYLRIEPAGTTPGPAQRRIDVEPKLVEDLNTAVTEIKCQLSPTGCPLE